VTRREGGVLIIEVEPDDTCELCGMVEELRPYGPNGARICFDCGMEDEPGTAARAAAFLFPDSPTATDAVHVGLKVADLNRRKRRKL
jgi:hypothetical protein